MTAPQLVDFIVIGAQKAGTTALFEYLAEDREIGLSRVKEVHFFDDETVDWQAPDYSLYHSHFDWNEGVLHGEATPIYVYWPESLQRIARYNPDVKLILLLRDPIARAWSHWRMEYARGVEKQLFGWCVRDGRMRLQAAGASAANREFSYVERGFYGAQVSQIYNLFPQDQVLIGRADELRRAPNGILQSVYAFLGLAPPAWRIAREVHVGRDMDYGGDLDEEDIAYLKQVYATDDCLLKSLTGISFR